MFSPKTILDILTAMGLFAALLATLEFWYYLGVRARRKRAEHPDTLSNIQGATLGLLALLLGFSFAVAMGRFSDREKLIVQEANAIGTVWLRCDLLPDLQRDAMRQLLREYTAQRIALYDAMEDSTRAVAISESEKLQTQLWTVFVENSKAMPGLSPVLLPDVNELIDLHGTRIAAGRRHMPAMVLALLIACCVVSVASVGYGCGVVGKRNVVLTTALTFLIAATLWAIIDMDHPRKGLIRVGQQPMIDLQQSLKR